MYKHANIIHQATQYIRTHYAEKLTLGQRGRTGISFPRLFQPHLRQEYRRYV